MEAIINGLVIAERLCPVSYDPSKTKNWNSGAA